jgi:hypothetical protein
MGRPKGLAKTGGRKLGTPNKNCQALSVKLDSLGCDPIEGLAKIALDPATKPELKVRCFAELAQYVYPKRKAVDLSLGDAGLQKLIIEYIAGPPSYIARVGVIITISKSPMPNA